jgi:hypothetical protein
METAIKPKYIICDLDGCLIDSKWIWGCVNSRKAPREEAFDMFNRLANADTNKIDLPLYKYLCFKCSGGLKLHFLTARSEEIEVETINFIQRKTGLIYGKEFTISSRPRNDVSSSAESKSVRVQKMLDDGVDIALAIDDEEAVLDMYKSKGIPCLKWIIGFVPVQVVQEYSSQINNLISVKEVLCQN